MSPYLQSQAENLPYAETPIAAADPGPTEEYNSEIQVQATDVVQDANEAVEVNVNEPKDTELVEPQTNEAAASITNEASAYEQTEAQINEAAESNLDEAIDTEQREPQTDEAAESNTNEALDTEQMEAQTDEAAESDLNEAIDTEEVEPQTNEAAESNIDEANEIIEEPASPEAAETHATAVLQDSNEDEQIEEVVDEAREIGVAEPQHLTQEAAEGAKTESETESDPMDPLLVADTIDFTPGIDSTPISEETGSPESALFLTEQDPFPEPAFFIADESEVGIQADLEREQTVEIRTFIDAIPETPSPPSEEVPPLDLHQVRHRGSSWQGQHSWAAQGYTDRHARSATHSGHFQEDSGYDWGQHQSYQSAWGYNHPSPYQAGMGVGYAGQAYPGLGFAGQWQPYPPYRHAPYGAQFPGQQPGHYTDRSPAAQVQPSAGFTGHWQPYPPYSHASHGAQIPGQQPGHYTDRNTAAQAPGPGFTGHWHSYSHAPHGAQFPGQQPGLYSERGTAYTSSYHSTGDFTGNRVNPGRGHQTGFPHQGQQNDYNPSNHESTVMAAYTGNTPSENRSRNYNHPSRHVAGYSNDPSPRPDSSRQSPTRARRYSQSGKYCNLCQSRPAHRDRVSLQCGQPC